MIIRNMVIKDQINLAACYFFKQDEITIKYH